MEKIPRDFTPAPPGLWPLLQRDISSVGCRWAARVGEASASDPSALVALHRPPPLTNAPEGIQPHARWPRQSSRSRGITKGSPQCYPHWHAPLTADTLTGQHKPGPLLASLPVFMFLSSPLKTANTHSAIQAEKCPTAVCASSLTTVNTNATIYLTEVKPRFYTSMWTYRTNFTASP